MNWFYDKLIVPLWKEYKLLGIVVAVILLMAVLAFAQYVLGVDVAGFFYNSGNMLRVNWNS